MTRSVLAFAGHRLVLDGGQELELRAALDSVVDDLGPVSGHGSLAGGADVLWAEALVDRGVPLHVVLPFDLEPFLDASVAPSGPGWVPRARALVARAASVTVATPGPFRDDGQYALATERYQGRAIAEADDLGVPPVFAVVWDGSAASGAAGTGADVARWCAIEGEPVVVAPVGRRVRGSGTTNPGDGG